jgi:hypothetical protein
MLFVPEQHSGMLLAFTGTTTEKQSEATLKA